MLQVDRSRSRRPSVDRRADRLVAMAGIALALGFLALTLASAVLTPAQRYGVWLPLHLALAGAASIAIAAIMPFFSAAIARAQPVSSWVRWTSIVAVALGAFGLTLGWVWPAHELAALAGVVYLVGIGLTALATLRPLAGGLGPWGGVVTVGYAAALAFVAIGAMLAILRLLGLEAVTSAWAWLKPAHAWLNLVGFVSLVIATTLLHFFPTVIGARIKRTASAYATVIGLGLGAVLVATGYGLRSDLLARLGAAMTLVGMAALWLYAAQVWRTRARWTGDRGWHVFAMGGLVSAIGWFGVGMVLAAGRVLLAGTDSTASSSDLLVAPIAAGWMGLALLASATHLVPSVGPGGPLEHARQRALLGRLGTVRLVLADVGIVALAVGHPWDLPVLTAAGLALVALTLLGTTALVAVAVGSGLRDARRSGTPQS